MDPTEIKLFDRSSLKSEARRFLEEKSARLPCYEQIWKL